MPEETTLTSSNIRYLLAIKNLEKDGRGVRCVDIARELGLSRPSVHNMTDTLVEMGLVTRNASSAASLTKRGEDIAERYGRYYASVSKLLIENFPNIDNIQTAACFLLSEVPEGNLKAFSNER